MAVKNLVIVESPAKAKTISKFLGNEYSVLASYGHIRDLPKSKIGVDIEDDFSPQYVLSKDKNHVKAIKAIKDAYDPSKTEVYVATDEDREGEAIGWHLLETLKVKNALKTKRIVFHEITKSAIQNAFDNPVKLNIDLVNAQQARRILDRLVGYELSPLLWKKIRYGLSAGRVQSVAVRLVVEREEEILAFVSEEYWSIEGTFLKNGKDEFLAKLFKFEGKNVDLKCKEDSEAIVKKLSSKEFTVSNIETKEFQKNPSPPFTTSTLQQEASRKFGFPVKRTMQIAQGLYEGVDLGNGNEGLITYMRTDSTALSKVALEQSKEVITQEFGKEYALENSRIYKNAKNAQEAHEAIRPTNLLHSPERIQSYLNAEQYKLYSIIWKRTIASQMASSKVRSVAVDLERDSYIFRATGQQVLFPGFMKVYTEGTDDEDKNDEEMNLPSFTKGEKVMAKDILPLQHFTKPKPRYTEASLVKKLEELGIGRPSTYAPTISTIQARGYVVSEKKQLMPTDTAFVVTRFLKDHFPEIVDYPFTAEMEQKLDDIAEGKLEWVKMLENFYKPFHSLITTKTDGVSKQEVVSETIEKMCPECGKNLVKKLSRYGMFISCSGYPECKYSEKLQADERENKSLGKDPQTGLEVFALVGRYGPYVKLGEDEILSDEEKKKAKKDKTKKKKLKMASIIPPHTFETLTLEGALELLSLPRVLGQEDSFDILANSGRYGPYVQKDKEFRSLPNDGTIFRVTLEEALKLLHTPKTGKRGGSSSVAKVLGKDSSGKEITLRAGRFGPYVSDGKLNASVPKTLDSDTLTLDDAKKLLEKKAEKK